MENNHHLLKDLEESIRNIWMTAAKARDFGSAGEYTMPAEKQVTAKNAALDYIIWFCAEAGAREPICEWMHAGEYWQTECGRTFGFIKSAQNPFSYCCYCGRKAHAQT